MINLKQVPEAKGALVGGQEDKGDKGYRVDMGDRQGRQGSCPLLLCFVLFSIMLGCISGACSSICQGNLSKQLPTAISGVTLPLSNPHQMSKCFPQLFVSWKLEMFYSHWLVPRWWKRHIWFSSLHICKKIRKKISAFSSTCKDLHCDGIKIWLLSILNSKLACEIAHWPELSRGYSHVELAAKKRDWGSALRSGWFFSERDFYLRVM